MATPKTLPKWTESAISTADRSSTGQFLAVKLSGDRTVILMASDNDIPYGVLQNDPGAGQQAVVMKEGKCPIIAAETLTAGDQIRFDSAGKLPCLSHSPTPPSTALVSAPSVPPLQRSLKLSLTAPTQCWVTQLAKNKAITSHKGDGENKWRFPA